MPALVPFGWGGLGFLLIIFFRWTKSRYDYETTNTDTFIAVTFMIISLYLIYILIVRTTIVFLPG